MTTAEFSRFAGQNGFTVDGESRMDYPVDRMRSTGEGNVLVDIHKLSSCSQEILFHVSPCLGTSLVAQVVKSLPAILETQEDPLEKGKTTHSGIVAWRIPWT